MKNSSLASAFLCLCFGLLPAGCETTSGVKLADWSGASGSDNKAQEHRVKFSEEGDAASLRWLLTHRVRQGMKLEEVNDVMGQHGEEEPNGQRFKAKDGMTFRGDSVYRWGPDSEGTSIYLVFREGRLARFDPKDFEQK